MNQRLHRSSAAPGRRLNAAASHDAQASEAASNVADSCACRVSHDPGRTGVAAQAAAHADLD